MSQKRMVISGTALVAVAGLAIFFVFAAEKEIRVTSFEECVAAGNAVMESYPRRCRAQSGKVFTEVPQASMPTGNFEERERVGAVEDEATGETITASGVVREVDLEAMMVDGPARVTVMGDTGKEVTILVPSMGLPLCSAYGSIADVSLLRAGQRVEARGASTAAGDIIPCEGEDHYLRVLES